MTSPGKGQRFLLMSIAALFVLSGIIRIGTSGLAMAKATEADQATSSAAIASAPKPEYLQKILEDIQSRQTALDQREAEILDREAAQSLANQVIDRRLSELKDAEAQLAATIAQVDGASERDLERLTNMYAAMKPKVAAELFEQMDAEFAAGFLGRMQSDAAGAIMTGLTPQKAYAISVYLAGRNAKVPKN